MIFLLGGYDLEMKAIRDILELKKIKYFDKKLTWGAQLSAYENEFNDEDTFYAIELEEDIPPPKNYYCIDHHNEKNNEKSSLEQVADILGIELTRHQHLVALNDSRYIDGMRSIYATNEEIRYIRSLDRQIQGVSQKDEELALSSIKEAQDNIIFSHTDKFSAVSDKIYDTKKNYIIYNESALVFYGYQIRELFEFLQTQKIEKESYYYGGGDFGFLGIREGILSSKGIEKLIKNFQEYSKNDDSISHHTFMFPFLFGDEKSLSLNEEWKFKEFSDSYNETAYFHSFFRDSMFTKSQDANSAFYTHKRYKNSNLTLTTRNNTYSLHVKSINLRVFKEMGVAILSLHVENRRYHDIQSVLEINEFTRRLYPEYLDANLQCTLVPKCIKLDDIEENFTYTQQAKKPEISNIIKTILGEKLVQSKSFRPAVDDRMFVISFYKNGAFANRLKENYETDDKWYEYVFIDADGKTVQNRSMQSKLIQKATYARWQGYGTLYGLSKYSFVCVAENSDFIQNTVQKHMQTVYFQMFTLLLMLRATILKFSAEVSDTANKIEKSNLAKDVNELYAHYIRFVNNFYFREITAKDQGLEIYEKAIKILNIERDIKDLDAEIEELHKFMEMKETQKMEKSVHTLNLIGFAFIIISTITGIFGMNILPDKWTKYIQYILENLF